MIKFDETKQLDHVSGALALRRDIEAVVDDLSDRGYDQLCYLGIGGTWASGLQAESHVKQLGDIPVAVENAAQYTTTGNRRITERSVVVVSSVTGTTPEVVRAVEQLREVGATVVGFVDEPASPLAELVTTCFSYPGAEQVKFFTVADRFLRNAGQFDGYDDLYADLDASLAPALVAVGKEADPFAADFAQQHHDDALHYFVGAGTQYGSTYSYAMCYWEEQHWLRSKSVHAAEFLHGTLEVVDRDTNVTVFLGEDAERPLAERVAEFLPRVCANVTLIDSRDYALPGIAAEHRGHLSHLVTHAVTERIDAHVERLNRHPVDIRRYYRALSY